LSTSRQTKAFVKFYIGIWIWLGCHGRAFLATWLGSIFRLRESGDTLCTFLLAFHLLTLLPFFDLLWLFGAHRPIGVFVLPLRTI